MQNERRKKLLETAKKFNKTQKKEIISLGSEIEDLGFNPSGIKAIDTFLGGGFKRGGHTIVWGIYSVGKTALVLSTIANAQKEGKTVCYVNTEKPIEPERFEFFGINLDDLLYIEAPANAEYALEALRTFCKEKVIDIFVIDSINGLCPKSVGETKTGAERGLDKKNVASLPLTLSNFYNVVNPYVFNSRASVIWIGQARTQGIGTFFTRLGLSGGNAQLFYAYQIIAMRRGQNSDAPVRKVKRYFLDKDNNIRYKTESIAIGFDTVLKMDKTNCCNSAKEKSEIHIPFVLDKGFVSESPELESLPIVIEGEGMTQEDKEYIAKELLEKGILKPDIAPEDIDVEKEIDPELKIEEPLKEKKKRGRPKKEKK